MTAGLGSPYEDSLPFSSLNNPTDIARAHAAVQKAWAQILPSLVDDAALRERLRLRLAYIVSDLMRRVPSDDDLAAQAIEKLRESVDPDALI